MPESPAGREARSTAPLRPLTSAERARLPLIDLITRDALDDEYGEVARRAQARATGPTGPGTGPTGPRRPGLLGAVAVLAFAVLVTISFQQTRSNADVVDAGRATLEERIGLRREVTSRLQDQIVALRADNTAAQGTGEVLDASADDAQAQVDRLRARTGLAADTGEGVRLVVDDSPDGLARHRVYDEDLALLCNGLWAAGATAVAVGGQRLTAVSAFRFSGGAIRLNGTTLVPPYVVEALGDTRTLQADLLDTTTGLAFSNRAAEFGFALDVQNVDDLRLPPAPERLADLRSARPGSGRDQDPPSGEDQP